MKNTSYHRSGGRPTESFPRGIVCVAQTIQDGNSRKRVKRLVNGIASRHEGVRAINPVHTMHLTFMTVLVAMINAKTCAQNNSATLFDDFESFINQEVGTEPVRVWVHEKTPLIAVGNSSNKLGLRIHPDPNLLTMRKNLIRLC